ncbi:SIR2 family protein [Streptomyces sp. NPDC057136]|uniref:SIR2 family protein n=1 Tax=Streptomyces sp. NPDC057136 TaxID=3346029 RepID=UPI00362AD131
MRQAIIDGVITTNYALGIPGTDSIHGNVEEPEKLVLTGEGCQRLDGRNDYLAAELLTIFVEHSVIVLGYSLSDRNGIGALETITTCLASSNIDHLATNRLIVVEWDDARTEPEVAPSTLVFDQILIPITLVRARDFRPVFSALAAFDRPFPAPLLRRLSDHVYRLVLTLPDQPSSLVVTGIDSTEAAGLRVVFGVGRFDDRDIADLGFRSLVRANLVQDILGTGVMPLRDDAVLASVLPQLSRTTRYVRVWKYLRDVGRIDDLRPSDYCTRRFTRLASVPSRPCDLEVLLRRMTDCGSSTSHATAFHTCECLYGLLRHGPGQPQRNTPAAREGWLQDA